MRISFFPSQSSSPSFSRDPIILPLEFRKYLFRELCMVTNFNFDMCDDQASYNVGKMSVEKCKQTFEELFGETEKPLVGKWMFSLAIYENFPTSQIPNFLNQYA